MSTRSKAAPRFGLDGRSTCLKHVLEQVLEADSTSPLYKSVLEHFGNDEDKFNVVDYFLCNQTFFENLTYTERILENPSETDPAKHIYKTEIHDVPNYLRANCIFFKRFLEDKKNEGADVNTEKFYLGITFNDFMDWKAEDMTMKTASLRVAKSRDIVMDFNKGVKREPPLFSHWCFSGQVDANQLPSPPPVEPLKTEDAVDSTPSSPGSRKLLAIPTCVPPSKEAVYAILPNDDDDSNAKENIEYTASHSSHESVDEAAPSKVFNMDPQLSLFHGGYRVVPTVKLKMIPSDIIAELHLQATDLRASAGSTTCAFSDGLDSGPSYNAFTMMSGSIATMMIQGFGNHGSDDASYPCMGSATSRGANIQGHYYDLRGVFFTVCSILCDPSWHYLTPILAQDLGEDVKSDAKRRVKTCQVFCDCVASSTILFYAHANSKTHASPFQLLDIDEHSRETTLATWCIPCLKRIHGVLLSSNECEWFRTDPRNSDVASPSFQSEPRTTSIASGLTSTLNSSTVDIESRLPTRLHAVATGASLSSPFYFHYVLTSAPSPNKFLINLSGINMGRTTTDTMGQYDDPTMSIGSVPATESGAVTILGRRANTGDAIVSLCSLFCAPSGHTTPSLAPQDHGETSTEQQSPSPIVAAAMFEFGENVTIVRDEEASVCARGISQSDVLNSGAEMSIAEPNTAGTIGDFGDNEIPNDFFDDWSHNVDDLESDDGSNEEIALELAFDGTVNGSVKPQEEKSYENAIEIEEQAQVPVKLPIKGATIALITMDPCIDRTDDNDVEGSKDGREIQDDEVLILDRLELLMGTVELPNETVNRVERQECAMTLIDVKEYDMMDKDKILQNDGYDDRVPALRFECDSFHAQVLTFLLTNSLMSSHTSNDAEPVAWTRRNLFHTDGITFSLSGRFENLQVTNVPRSRVLHYVYSDDTPTSQDVYSDFGINDTIGYKGVPTAIRVDLESIPHDPSSIRVLPNTENEYLLMMQGGHMSEQGLTPEDEAYQYMLSTDTYRTGSKPKGALSHDEIDQAASATSPTILLLTEYVVSNLIKQDPANIIYGNESTESSGNTAHPFPVVANHVDCFEDTTIDDDDEDISEDISCLFPDLAEFILDLQSEFERSIAAVLDDDDLIASPGSASPVRSELIALNDLPSPSGAEKLPSPTAQVQLDCFPKIFDVDDDCTIVSPLDMNSFIDEFSRKNAMNLESLMGSIVIGEHFYSNSLRLKAPSDSDATVLPFDRGPSKLLTASNGSLRSLPFDRGPCLPPTALRVVPRLIDARRNKLLSRILLLVRNSLLRGLLSTRLLIFERLFVVSAFLFKKRVASSETTSPFYLFKETHGRIF